MTSKKWHKSAVTFAAVIGGAILGLSMAPQSAAAGMMNGWSCASNECCSAGSRDCCHLDGGICGTNCPIIVQ